MRFLKFEMGKHHFTNSHLTWTSMTNDYTDLSIGPTKIKSSYKFSFPYKRHQVSIYLF